MTGADDEITDIDLMAYVDGLLDPARAAAVEAHIRRSPAEAARLRDFADQRDAIRTAYAGVLGEPVPNRLQAVLEARLGAPRPRLPPGLGGLPRAAALAAFGATMGLAGWLVGRQELPDAVMAGAFPPPAASMAAGPLAQAGALRTYAVAGDPAAPEPGVLMAVAAPDLSAAGFVLSDRQILSTDQPGAVQLAYEDADGDRIDIAILIGAEDGPRRVRVSAGEAGPAYWFDGPLTYVLTGDIADSDLLALTEAIAASAAVAAGPAATLAGLDAIDAGAAQEAVIEAGPTEDVVPLSPLDLPLGEATAPM